MLIANNLCGFGGSGTPTFVKRYSSSVNNVNLYSDIGSPITRGNVLVTIDSGVQIGSSNISLAAFDVGAFPVGFSIKITNNGHIYGRGGAGGAGSTSDTEPAGSGGPGGLAFKTTVPITIDNTSGVIAGGGGGGGGGAAINIGDAKSPFILNGGNGGTGAGSQNSGVASAGSLGDAGDGSLAGGSGGSLGNSGSGGNGSSLGGPGSGGGGGNYIDGSSHVTWIGAGSRLGGAIN